jgi:hypothetical protein
MDTDEILRDEKAARAAAEAFWDSAIKERARVFPEAVQAAIHIFYVTGYVDGWQRHKYGEADATR